MLLPYRRVQPYIHTFKNSCINTLEYYTTPNKLWQYRWVPPHPIPSLWCNSTSSLSIYREGTITITKDPNTMTMMFDTTSTSITTNIADDLERPLVPDDSGQLPGQRNEPLKSYSNNGHYFNWQGAFGLTYRQRLPSPATHSTQEANLHTDINDELDAIIGRTLRRLVLVNHTQEEPNHSKYRAKDFNSQASKFPDVPDRGSCLSLEVIAGPTCGLRDSVRSTDTSRLPLTLGRVPPSNLMLMDSEVSGKHAMISWNSNKRCWEVVDIGSLNGTLLNSKAIHHPDSGSRRRGEPRELVTGDVITLGNTSQLNVQITPLLESEIPFGVGTASDPMSMRRGGKKLPMEDVCYYKWPLPGVDEFGVFGICDGHGGKLAAQYASKTLPEMIVAILSDSSRREKVLSLQDASDVLRDAFSRTEACLNYYYEGCTATLLLVWADGHGSLFAQCANVGDSACVVNIDGKNIKMTEDHRITSYSERQRINETGDPLKDGDTRLCGLNLGRVLGDKFLKEQDARISSKPYISPVIHIDEKSKAFALLASDGLWDVISEKKAVHLVLQAKERYSSDRKDMGNEIAKMLLNEARTLRTKDNTSVLYVDFDASFRT